MQFTIFAVSALVALVSAEPRPRVARPPVCGGNTIAACCQTDGSSSTYHYEESFDCVSPGDPTSIKKFRAFCAATGRTAECCQSFVAGSGEGCQDI